MGRLTCLLTETILETRLDSDLVPFYTVLRRIELEVVATVDRGDTISELATKLGHNESYLSRAVGDLARRGSPTRNAATAENGSSRRTLVPSNSTSTSSASTPILTSPSC
jgi:hypothetical protein